MSGRAALMSRVTLWAARVAWVLVAVVGGRAIGDAAAERSTPVQVIATVGAWTGWAVAALCLAVPAVVTLTALRALVPGAVAVTVAALVFGADPGAGLALGVPSLAAAVLAASAETGRSYLQASAYGDERRFGLRPPLGYLTATAVSWVVWVTAVIAAPLAWAARAWELAATTTAVVVAATVLLPRRWHQLSLRWLVSVPAGLVVHDPVVLAETLMLPRHQIVAVGAEVLGLGAAPGALDLTGPTPGLSIAIHLHEPTTAVLAARPSRPRGTTVHAWALLVALTRPGAALAEARRRRLPVS